MSDTAPEADLRVMDAICRTDFASFVRRSFHTLHPGAQFHMTWHIRALAYALEQVRQGTVRRLIINLPPGTLKSFMASIAWPAFVLGHDPTKRIAVVNYGSELAVDLGNSFRQIIHSPQYQTMFPLMQTVGMKDTETDVRTTQNGFRLGTTLKGALTGLHADIVIVDDPIKPMDALSDTERERTNALFTNTVSSRLSDPRTGAIIVVMQRLHEDDLTGMLLRTSNQWKLLSLPAIAQADEWVPISDHQYHVRRVHDVLRPRRETLDELLDRCSEIGPDTFAAQYQQTPVPASGVMIRRSDFRYYDELPREAMSSPVFQAWDVASKDGELNDWSVCTTWRYHKQKYYLVDLLRDRLDYPNLRERAIYHARLHKASIVRIEDAGLGTALIAEMKRAGLQAVGVRPQESKQMRLQLQLGKFRNGQVLFPKGAFYLPDLEAELLAFPRGRFDDQMDSICLALSYEPSEYDLSTLAKGTEALASSLFWQSQFLGRLR